MTERSEDALKACPFDETVECELKHALDNYGDDPNDNGALNRLVNNCVTIGYEFATRSEASPPVIDEGMVSRLIECAKAHQLAVEYGDALAKKSAFGKLQDARAALEAGCAGLVAENARHRTMLDTLSRRAALVMQMLEDDGPQVVPHLIDTDDNPGQYLRVAIDTARTALRGDREQGEG